MVVRESREWKKNGERRRKIKQKENWKFTREKMKGEKEKRELKKRWEITEKGVRVKRNKGIEGSD